MRVEWKDPADAERLRQLVAGEANARRRDRYRAVLPAGQGLGDRPELTREQIAAGVGRSRQLVDEWVGRYRRSGGGVESLRPREQPGAAAELTAAGQAELTAMLDAGPPEADGLAAYNGPILRERISERFGKLCSLPGLYALPHRLRYNDLVPRTTHPGSSPAAQEGFKKRRRPSGSSGQRPPTPASGS
jgi:transposase